MQPESEFVVAFTVPHLIPPSVNHIWQPIVYTSRKTGLPVRGRKISPEGRAFRNAVAIFSRGRSVIPALNRKRAKYGVLIDVYLGPNQRGDFDNFFKAGLDALVLCGVIHSDAAVDGRLSRCIVHKEDRENPRTEYTVTRLGE